MDTALTAPARARHGARMRGLVLLGLLVSSFALLLALTPRAEAFVYWTNQTGYSIGRANNNATGVNQNFITGLDRVFDVTSTTGTSGGRAGTPSVAQASTAPT